MNKAYRLKGIVRYFCSLPALLFQYQYSPAQVAGLDSTFNGDGILITSSAQNSGIIAVQADGKLLVGGGYFENGNEFIQISRHKVNGSPDSSFGNNGMVLTDFNNNYETILLIRLCPDAKIIMLGYANSGGYLMPRYFPDGKIDSSFNLDGKLELDFSATNGLLTDSEVQADGKILLAGSCLFGYSSGFLIMRLNSEGTMDNSFGAAGIVHYNF